MNTHDKFTTDFGDFVASFRLHIAARNPQGHMLCADGPGFTSGFMHRLVYCLGKLCKGDKRSVHLLQDLDWSSHKGLLASLGRAMAEAVPDPKAKPSLIRRYSGSCVDLHRLQMLMSPHKGPEDSLLFIISVPAHAVREDMIPCFAQLRALLSASIHLWVVVAPTSLLNFGEGRCGSSFSSLFRAYLLAWPSINSAPYHTLMDSAENTDRYLITMPRGPQVCLLAHHSQVKV